MCQVTVTDSVTGVLVVIVGDMSYGTIVSIRAALDDAWSRLGTGVLVLDLSDVTFLDSAGKSGLLDTAGAAIPTPAGRRPLRVVVDHTRAVTRPLEITGLDLLLELHDTRESALRVS